MYCDPEQKEPQVQSQVQPHCCIRRRGLDLRTSGEQGKHYWGEGHRITGARGLAMGCMEGA